MKVAIINGGLMYHNMFLNEGWEVVDEEQADLICFTGGEDVSPHLYGEKRHPYTYNNPDRDEEEKKIFLNNLGTPMVGICRGGQFLHVMCGGKMWQDVDNHAISGTHACLDIPSGEIFQVTSTHHQMMCDDGSGVVIGRANLTTRRECVTDEHGIVRVEPEGEMTDVEVVLHREEGVLCFQPHPEFHGHQSTRDYFFTLLERELGLKA